MKEEITMENDNYTIWLEKEIEQLKDDLTYYQKTSAMLQKALEEAQKGFQAIAEYTAEMEALRKESKYSNGLVRIWNYAKYRASEMQQISNYKKENHHVQDEKRQ